ncbi:MAG: hypothetical protein QY326_04780 [Bdellovibrionota bacterium]|nr:MAG: hypothetical protein QY326_04780 [Bdellovibrionota bacterium]
MKQLLVLGMLLGTLSGCGETPPNSMEYGTIGGAGGAALGAGAGALIGSAIANGDVGTSALLGAGIGLPVGVVLGVVYAVQEEKSELEARDELIQSNNDAIMEREEELRRMRLRAVEESSNIRPNENRRDTLYTGPTVSPYYR